jgi:hypothetical protein
MVLLYYGNLQTKISVVLVVALGVLSISFFFLEGGNPLKGRVFYRLVPVAGGGVLWVIPVDEINVFMGCILLGLWSYLVYLHVTMLL